MILDICGGEAGSIVEAGKAVNEPRTYPFDTQMTKKLTSVDIEEKEQLYILGNLGFEIDGNSSPYMVQAPSWRPDILGPVDLVEEIIRVYGYDNIEALPVSRETLLTNNALSNTHNLRMKAGRILANRGMQECITWSFMSQELAKDFIADGVINSALILNNPVSVEMDIMRPSILPNLIQAAARNADRSYPNAALFETGPVFYGVNPDDQSNMAAGVRHGIHADKHWTSPDVSRPVDAYDAKADALAVIQSINPTLNPQLSLDAPSYYHPGRSGTFRLGKNILATFGEIHPMILDQIDITAPVVGFEVMMDNIPQPKVVVGARPALTLNPLQPVTRDFAFVVANDIAADSIVFSVQKGGGNLVQNIRIFDIYQGKGVPEGHKSVAVTVQFQPSEKTLNDKEIEALCKAVIDSVISKTGASLRG
jgi:phenylalanyl-tRNA synthetase beta chain